VSRDTEWTVSLKHRLLTVKEGVNGGERTIRERKTTHNHDAPRTLNLPAATALGSLATCGSQIAGKLQA